LTTVKEGCYDGGMDETRDELIATSPRDRELVRFALRRLLTDEEATTVDDKTYALRLLRQFSEPSERIHRMAGRQNDPEYRKYHAGAAP